MLDVALAELACRGTQDVLPCQLRTGRHERDDVLQLVPEPVRTAGLVEGGPGPHPAGQRLVEQPGVEHDVHRAVRRLHLDGAKDAVPVVRQRSQGLPVIGGPMAPDQVGSERGVRRPARGGPGRRHDLPGRARSWSGARRTDPARHQRCLRECAPWRGPRARRVPRCGRGTRSDRPSRRSGARPGPGRRSGSRTRCSTGCAPGAPPSRARAR